MIPGAASRAGEGPDERLRGLRVLVVEDEAIISMELEDMLEGLGVEVVGVTGNADDALRLAAAERPDLVAMDVNLRGPRDGIEAATEIFGRFGLRSLFITAYGDGETVARAEAARPAGWLTKPVTRRRLAAALVEALPRRGDA